MGNLIKYEWRKQRTSRLLILASLIISIILMIGGSISESDVVIGFGVLIISIAGMFSVFYLGIESLIVYNRDLRTKQSYMLFMVPHSTWEILGAKFISAILQMFFAAVAFLVGMAVCFSVIAVYETSIGELMRAIWEFIGRTPEFNWIPILQALLLLFIVWTMVIMTGFLAVTLSRTVLLKSKFAGLISVVLFFVISGVTERIHIFLINLRNVTAQGILSQISFFDYAFYILVCMILFFVSGWIADRKLSI